MVSISRTTAIEDVTKFRAALFAYDYKYTVLFDIAISTGYRITDMLYLKVKDVRRDGLALTERKTGKQRTVVLPDKVKENCLKYIKDNRLRSDDFLFCTHNDRNSHLTRQQVFRVFKSTANFLGLGGVISPHSCRKTYARAKYAEHGDIDALQADMGHSCKSTTIGYLVDLPK